MPLTTPAASPRPDIFASRDARQFVRQLCDWRQQHERHFSFRKLARLADLGSPGYIQTFLNGERNLKPDTAARLGTALGLNAEENEYFVLLVAFTQAESDAERIGYYEQLLRRAVRHGTGRIDAARLSYFTEWFVPVVHAMASLKGFRADAAWISPRVVPAIRKADARRAIDVLKHLGILTVHDDLTVTVREPVLESAPGLSSLWVREYHRAMIRLSERAIDLLPENDRTVLGFTVTVPRDRIDEVRKWGDEMLQELFYRILSIQREGTDVEGEVVQCNLQMFRMTRIHEEAP